MNISKKMIMSFIVALTSVVSMAQPYYHIMKEVDGKLIEDTVYNGMDYNIKINMIEPKPKDAIGDKITVPCSGRSFWFTNKGNVYYDISTNKFHFERSQLEYALWPSIGQDHKGHFYFGNNITSCIDPDPGWNSKELDCFYFINPNNLGKLQEDLGNEKWTVLSKCEWDYVCKNLGEYDWTVNGKTCFLIDTTPGKSLLTELRNKNNGNPRDLSIKEFKALEPQGLVCLPASGYEEYDNIHKYYYIYDTDWYACYWSYTYYDNRRIYGRPMYADYMWFYPNGSGVSHSIRTTRSGMAVRLVVLADED